MGVTNQVLSLRQTAEDNTANSSKSFSSKMKVLKKVKRRLGLASRGVSSGNPSANNLPPLLFHQVHGDNIRVSRDGRIARRAESFCKGVTFSARPVKVSEKICVKFLDVSNNWSGVLRFGFTSNDPSTLRYALPKYACPDLTNKPGYWAKALSERLCERDTVLFYYVTSAGDVHFGVNGEEKGIFFSGVDTRGQLWAMIDIYGNSTALEFLDSRQQLNNSRGSRHMEGQDVDRLITPAMVNLSIHPPPPCIAAQPPEPPAVIETPPPPRFQHPSVKFNPLPFHRTRGRNVRLSNDRCIAMRNATEFCQGYVFTGRPLQLGERVVVQILATEPMYLGAMALGLTSCDPSMLTPADLPDDSDLLLDRPEYWVVSKDVTNYPQQGDELAFCITHSGEVQMSKNGSPPVTLMHVDQSLTLWAFLDIFGSTQKIRILGSTMQHQQSGPSPPRVVIPSSSERCCPVAVTTAPGLGGGTVLVVNLPPVQQPIQPQLPPTTTSQQTQPSPNQHTDSTHSSTLVSNYSNTYIEPVTVTSYSTIESAAGICEWAETNITSPQSSDCSVCYERSIDSVLYSCGHMCMCYECAVQQWRGKGGGHCPICRALIRDVIRTFKS